MINRELRSVLIAVALTGVSACSAVHVRDAAPRAMQSAPSSAISDRAAASLRALELDLARCGDEPKPCLDALENTATPHDEDRLLAMAELQWRSAQAHGRGGDRERTEDCLRSARTAYAALAFAVPRRPEPLRALYNQALACVAVQRLVHSADGGPITIGNALPPPWHLRPGQFGLRLPGGVRPDEWLSAAHLRTDGIRNEHRRPGLGAAMVTITQTPAGEASLPLRTPRFLPATLVLHFPAANLDEALHGHDVVVDLLDPYATDRVRVGEGDGSHEDALAADFTAPYALWLSRSRLARQGDLALLRGRDAMASPQVFAMQPYDPQRRIVVLVHGRGSSPEAWANLANDILGDDALRRRYQLWQVFYPTNLPIAENVRGIRAALADALYSVDPAGTAPASHDITLIGHSMGGVVARLLAVESADALWRAFFDRPVDDAERARLALLEPYLTLSPMPQVQRLILLAAPHRGSPMAGSWLGRSAARLVRLPETLLGRVAEVADALQRDAPEQADALRRRQMDSIEALSDQGGYLRAAAGLPLGPGIAVHSIIGRKDPSVPLSQSSDGVVPYTSAHLDGAVSELIVTSGHGVQDTPEAIVEIRRILREGTNDAAAPDFLPAQQRSP